MLKAKSNENLVPNWSNFGGFRASRHGAQKVAKGTSLRECTSFKLFRVIIGQRSDPVDVRTRGRRRKNRIFHIFLEKPPLIRLSLKFWFGGIID